MRRTISSAAKRILPPGGDRERSKKSGTLAAWRTDRNLKIVGVACWPGAALRTLPTVGLVLSRKRPRTGFLQPAAHIEALRGHAVRYRLTLLRRSYEVHLVPRRDRHGKVIGVRGVLRAVPKGSAPKRTWDRAPSPDLALARSLSETRTRRDRTSLRSAIQSLALAKAVADTARVNAEIRSDRAAAQQQRALQAQIRAEEEERRARLLADASAILDSSFDLDDTLNRVGKLLVLRMADFAILHFREGGGLLRLMVHGRDELHVTLLNEAFPPGEESGFFESGRYESGFLESELLDKVSLSRWDLFPTLMPEDVAALLPRGPRRRAFRQIGVQSLIRVPIVSHGRLIGLLILGSGDPGRLFTNLDLQMAKDLAARIGLARASSLLFHEAQKEIALRREAEARLRVFNIELEQRVHERTALLEDATREANSFAYTVAHDLRAPLRAITGFCQALREDYAGLLDELGKDYLDRIVSGARRMDDLIRDLLDYARLNRAEIRKGIVDLDLLMDEVLLPLAGDLEERKARVSVAKPLGCVVGQGGVLGQALTNLISNAVKFVAPGVKPEVSIRAERTKERVRIVVADNGIGIAP
jgi:signal transduction histidine kinase